MFLVTIKQFKLAMRLPNGLDWKNNTLIYLGVKNEKELWKWKEKLGEKAIVWHEPDIDNEATALAYLGEDNAFPDLRLI